MSGDQEYLARNDASRARLRALVERLSEADLRRPLGAGWTVSAALAHLAFWDRRNEGLLADWERGGVRITPVDADAVNEAALPAWRAIPPRDAAREVLAAAEAVDRKIAALPAELAQAIRTARPISVDRSHHRDEHIEEIEQALRPQP